MSATELVDVGLAPGVPVPTPGVPTWGARPPAVHKRMIAAAAKVAGATTAIRKQTAHTTVLTAMRELARVKLSGSDKREIVIDAFLHGAEASFRELFADQGAFISFVGRMVDDAYAVLGKKVFGRGGRCC